MNRRSIMIILIGAIAALAGGATIDFMRSRRCVDLQGKWVAATRLCELPGGETVGTGSVTIFATGALVTAAALFTLFRALQFASGRATSIFAGKAPQSGDDTNV
jgi:hypothetical protein